MSLPSLIWISRSTVEKNIGLDAGVAGGPGSTDPCDSANPPDYCSTDPDPCEQADALEDNSAFKAKMNQLLNDANNKDVENGYVLTKQDDGSFSYTHFEGTQHEASISVNHSIDGVIHSHPAGNYSIFSATDIKYIYELYKAGAIQNINTYTTGVVTSHGSTYLLKVSDLNKFLSFGDGALSDSFDSFKDFFVSLYGISTENSVQANEMAFLNMLSQVNGGNGAGLKLFKGNTDDFDSWQSKQVNSSGDIVNDNCN